MDFCLKRHLRENRELKHDSSDDDKFNEMFKVINMKVCNKPKYHVVNEVNTCGQQTK